MSPTPAPEPSTRPDVRDAEPEDLPLLQGIEAAADRTFEDAFGPLEFGDPTDGPTRARLPGFLLVAGRPPVGFAHVLWLDGAAHLEQLAVHPDHHRQGTGTALVRAAMARAAAAGHDRMTLSTYAEVVWNGPYYARLGFQVVEHPSPTLRRLVEVEEAKGLMRYGPRVVMQVALGGQVTGE